VCGIAVGTEVRNDDGSNCPYLRDNFPCLGEPAHMCVAGGKSAVRRRMARVLLDPEEQIRYGFFKAPADQMCMTYHLDGTADARPWTQAQRGFEMLDRDIGLPGS
jgi:hypothetical protein